MTVISGRNRKKKKIEKKEKEEKRREKKTVLNIKKSYQGIIDEHIYIQKMHTETARDFTSAAYLCPVHKRKDAASWRKKHHRKAS